MPVIDVPIIEGLKDEFNQFCPELLINNLPMIDGLLLSHKKILWGLYRNRVTPDKPYIKSLKAIGYITNYYVFGDAPLYSTMTNMANNGMNIPLLDGKGSWGNKFKADGVPSHQRYTDCKLTFYALDMLKAVDKNIVPMKPNFDNSDMEIILAPSYAPNILLNVSQSISVSEASKIPSFNTIETCDSIINYIKTKDIDKSIDIIKSVDMSSGGRVVYNKEIYEKIFKTGKGSFTLVGKYRFDDKKNIFSIYEIPYETTIDAIENKIAENYDKGLFKEVTDIRNASGKDGIRLDIYLKKNTNIQQFEQKLRKYTPYQCNFACNFTVLDLDCKTPLLMSLEDIYIRWVQHRINCIKNETIYDINKNKEELNKLHGLQIINNDLDTAIKLIRQSKSEKVAIENLINYFNLNQKQAEYISTIRLVNINQEWIGNKINNINSLEQENIKLDKYYHSEQSIKETIINQLEDVKKKYGKERLTEVIYPEEDIAITQEDLIEQYTCKLVYTKEMYLKKLLKSSDQQKLKDNDQIIGEISSTNKSTLLFFTNKQNRYRLPCHQLDTCTPSALGTYMPNILDLEKDEQVIKVVSIEDIKGYILSVFANGKVSKIDIKSYMSNYTKLNNCYATESKLIDIDYIEKDVDILFITEEGKMLIANSSQIADKSSRNSQGNIAINTDSKVIAAIIDIKPEMNFTIETEKGKKIDFNLSDIAQTGKSNEERTLFNYCYGNVRNKGNYIYYNKSDKIINFTLNK